MYKKRRLFLIFISIFSITSVFSQFNTLRPIKKEYIVISVDSSKTIRANHGMENNRAKEELNFIDSISISDSVAVTSHRVENTKNRLSLPLKKIDITSNYGYRKHPILKKRKFHYGIDFSAKNDEVYSIMPGIISKVGFSRRGLGNYVVIKYGDYKVTYGHLSLSIGTKGDVIQAGEIIGRSGNTGRSTGEHLHLSIKYKGKFINPAPIINYIKSIKN